MHSHYELYNKNNSFCLIIWAFQWNIFFPYKLLYIIFISRINYLKRLQFVVSSFSYFTESVLSSSEFKELIHLILMYTVIKGIKFSYHNKKFKLLHSLLFTYIINHHHLHEIQYLQTKVSIWFTICSP